MAFLYKKVEERAFYRISGAVLDFFFCRCRSPPIVQAESMGTIFFFLVVVSGHVDIFRQLGIFFEFHFFLSLSWVSDLEEPEMSFVLFVVIHTLVLNWVWVITFYNTTKRWEEIYE